MSDILLKVFNMSLSACWLVLAILILRPLLKKAPKYLRCAMWALVGIRLLCPFSLQSALSLIPSATPVSVAPQPVINNDPPLPVTPSTPTVDTNIQVNYGSSVILPSTADAYLTVLAVIWAAGVAAMLIYMLISYIRVHRGVREAALREGNVWECDSVQSPFILGLIRPRIYLPSGMSQQDAALVIAHEKAHLHRLDHLWKPLGFILLALHWFNPLMWLAYILLCRDIELACDERVLRQMGTEIKTEYSNALINCAVPRKMISACPLAFGEVGVKQRIKSVLNYKKPAFWIIIAAVVVLIATAICFLTNPLIPNKLDRELPNLIKAQHRPLRDDDYFQFATCSVLGTRTDGNITHVYAVVYYTEYLLDANAKLVKTQNGSHMPTVISVSQSDGEYSVLDYRTPKDGALYRDSIKDMFPWYLRPLTDTQLYIKRHQKEFDRHLEDVYEINNLPQDYMMSWEDGPQDINIHYTCSEEYTPGFSLEPATKNFHFDWSEYSSYRGYGKYEMTDDTLILRTSDGKYEYYFTADGEGWRFDASRSTDFPREHYSNENDLSDPFEDGVLFSLKYTSNDFSDILYDYTLYDFDKDGAPNVCTIGFGGTSGIFSFSVTIWDENETDILYQSTFYPSSPNWFSTLKFENDSGWNLYVCGVDQEGKSHRFKVTTDKNYLVLSEGGKWLAGSGKPQEPTVTQQLSSFFGRYSLYSADVIVISDYSELEELYDFMLGKSEAAYPRYVRLIGSGAYDDYQNGTYPPKFFRKQCLLAVMVESPSEDDRFSATVTQEDTRLRVDVTQTQSGEAPEEGSIYDTDGFIYLIPISREQAELVPYAVIHPNINS